MIELSNAGNHAALEKRAREWLKAWPQSGFVWQLLGAALRGQSKDALAALETAARCSPEDPVAHLNLGNARGRCGRLDEAAASFRRALGLWPDFAEAHYNLGDVQMELGQVDAAAASFRRAVDLRPGYADAHYSLGRACVKLKLPDAAIVAFRRALEQRPDFAEAHVNLGNAVRSIGRLDQAIAGYRRALEIRPNFMPALTELATALRLQRRMVEAEAVCHEALACAPDSAAALLVLAELRADAGRFGDAEGLFRRVTALDPESAEAWAGLTRVRRMTSGDGPWLTAVRGLLGRSLPPARECVLRYAMGKFFDDVDDPDAAFENYRSANELSKGLGPKHDRSQLTCAVDRIIRCHDARWLERRAGANRSARPIFIVGMLRSGTTLAEHILASHEAVYGAGELTFWSDALTSTLAGDCAVKTVGQPGDDQLAAQGLQYLELLESLSVNAVRVVDKLPTNFLALGIIHAALPEARIIHLRRHPLDTCLSIYFQQFEAANTYANDLADLAHYTGEYRRLMRHWRAVLPHGAMLEVPYEGLVEDLSGWTRTLLEFIDLPWDARCVEPHLTSRAVVTASKWRVRQPVDGASVGRWRRYEKFLADLLPLLQSDPD